MENAKALNSFNQAQRRTKRPLPNRKRAPGLRTRWCVRPVSVQGDHPRRERPDLRPTAQIRPKLDHSPDRSRILSHIVDPRRVNDHVVSWEPIVVIRQIVIDPIAVVVDVGLCELHAGKRYARGRLGQLLT
jgi:hypothetical protein